MKKMKKYFSLVLVAFIAMTSLLFTPTEKAEANVPDCSDRKFGISVCSYQYENHVDATVGNATYYYGYFYTMQLQRYINGKWTVVATRTGKIDDRSYPIEVETFKNVRWNNGKDKNKIYVKLFRDEKHLNYVGAVQSPYFYR